MRMILVSVCSSAVPDRVRGFNALREGPFGVNGSDLCSGYRRAAQYFENYLRRIHSALQVNQLATLPLWLQVACQTVLVSEFICTNPARSSTYRAQVPIRPALVLGIDLA